MGKPRDVQAAKVGEKYNFGSFGSADSSGVNMSDAANTNVATAQAGTQQYLNELLNPSYNSESFRARQDLLDASNQQYAKQMGADAIARGARGSATQNILNAIAANRNQNMREAMTQEDARVQNILNATQGVESNYFNQANTMADNILKRALSNQAAENAAIFANNAAQNKWRSGLITAAGGLAGAGLGAYFAPSINDEATDPNQVASANNLYG